VTAGPAQREPNAVDLWCVASAGDPRLRDGAATGDELALAGACCEVEESLRKGEWVALEAVLRHVDDDRLIPPRDPAARTALGEAMVRLGWHRAAPDPGANLHGTPLTAWDAVEVFAHYATADGGLEIPDDPAELDRLAAALELLGWHRPGPPEAVE
jgi:hypothetical protein